MKVRITCGIAGLHLLLKKELIDEEGKIKNIQRRAYQKVQERWTPYGCNWYGKNGDVDKEHINLFEEHLKEAKDKDIKEFQVTKIKTDDFFNKKYRVYYSGEDIVFIEVYK